ncbi:MAG TPA: hypothetical protein VKP58_15105 [Candidatus Acidoferrum sp.]|nr:hypothetical protein [Candidatus Acidoferrum sp.]
MKASITIETDIFEHREVKPHFVNPCCFGEDFAAWLTGQLSPLKETGFIFSQPIQEDYGWGFWASYEKTPFWVALSFVGNGPQDPPSQWVVTVAYDPGLNLMKRLFHKPNPQAFAQLRDRIWEALKSEQRIKILEMGSSRAS